MDTPQRETGKNAGQDLVSVVIPAWNAARFLRRCLDSLLAQTHENWECALVDDASTDETFDIAREYASRDSRFFVYRNTENAGCGLARRRAISLARGDWFAFVDADDYVDEDFLEAMLSACRRTGAEIAICGTKNRDGRGVYLGQDVAETEYTVSKEALYRQYMLSSWILQYNGNKLYARRVIDSAAYSPLRFCEDSATTYKWLWEANEAVVLPRSMYHYVRHPDSNSQTGNTPLRKAVDTCRCVHGHFRFCAENGFTDMLPRLREFARPHMVRAVATLPIGGGEYKEMDMIRKEMYND